MPIGAIYQKGQEVDVSDEYAEWLMNDSPGSFKKKRIRKPQVDKMIKSPQEEK